MSQPDSTHCPPATGSASSQATASFLPEVGDAAQAPIATTTTPAVAPRNDQTIISNRPPLAAPLATPMPQPSELRTVLIGERLGHFELQEYIGGGGMGAVFRALDTELNRFVALKVLARDQSHDDETVRRFRNEAQSAARLDHENIARVFFVGEDRGLHYIAFEHIEGVNIRALVERKGPLPVAEAIGYVLQVAEALSHANSRDVVHRDIKPSNILITANGRAKLVDMGLARVRRVDQSGEDLTASGVTLGTFDYISPEQARDPRSADVRSDIYSLGCTLYYMVTGRPPFPDGTVLQKLLQHQGDTPVDPSRLNPDLPEELCRIIRKMLAKDPKRRYQRPSELLADLLVLADDLGWQPQGAGSLVWLAPRSKGLTLLEQHLPWMAPLAALVVIALVLRYLWTPSAAPLPDFGGSDLLVAQEPRDATDAESRPQASPAKNLPNRNAQPTPEATETDFVSGQGGAANAGVRNNSAPEKAAVNRSTNARTGDGAPGDAASRDGSPNGLAEEDPDSGADSPEDDIPDGAAAAEGNAVSDGSGVTAPTTTVEDSATGDVTAPANDAPEADGDVPSVAGNSVGDDSDDASSEPASEEPDTAPAVADGSNDEPNRPSPPSDNVVGNQPDVKRPAAPPMSNQPNVLVVNPTGTGEREFRTLKAACQSAKSGDVIELRFNGRREESRPIRLENVRVTIRAGETYRPVVVFRPNEVDPLTYPRSMFTVSGGQLVMVNVAIELEIPRQIPSDRWALIEAQRAESLRLERCSLTIRNASESRLAYHQGVSFLEVTAPPGEGMMMDDAASPPPPPTPAVNIQLQNSIARGEAVFLRSPGQQAINLLWENGLLATTEQFYSASAGAISSRQANAVRIDLRHVTAVVRGGMCLLSSTDNARTQAIADFRISNSIVLCDASSALIQQMGVEGGNDFRKRVSWYGNRNFYEGFDTFWRTLPLNPQHLAEEWPIARWQTFWSMNESSPSWRKVLWRKLPDGARPINAHTPVDYALDMQSMNNPARGAGDDGRDVGLEPDQMPPLPPPPNAPESSPESAAATAPAPAAASAAR